MSLYAVPPQIMQHFFKLQMPVSKHRCLATLPLLRKCESDAFSYLESYSLTAFHVFAGAVFRLGIAYINSFLKVIGYQHV